VKAQSNVPVTLLDLYEPLFQYICMLSRIARKAGGEKIEFNALRGTIRGHLESITRNAQANPLLALQVKKLEMATIFFVDSMIAESKLSCAAQWHHNRLAYEKEELAGDEKFFDLLEENLNDSSKEATERLVIFYVCIGVGFTGWYATQPEYLRKKMETIAKRISGAMEPDPAARICPEAYQYLDTRNLIEKPTIKIGAIALIFLALCLVVLAVNFYLFKIGSVGLAQSLHEILRHDLSR
jgi:type IV/VI secretion system ImpK/VasF family protein